MAREAIVAQLTARTGLAPTLTPATADGFYFDNARQNRIIQVENTGAGSINVTIQTPALVDGNLTVSERVVPVAAGVTRYIGPFSNAVYGQVGNLVYVDTDTPADTDWAVLGLGAILN